MNTLNLAAIRDVEVTTDPFPFFYLPQVVDDEIAQQLTREFPDIQHGGSYDLEDVTISPAFKAFLDNFDTPEFRRLICEKFDVEVMDLPMMITLRGHSRAKDGRIHTDSKTKVVTVLVYLNDSWDAETGRLRMLRDGENIDNFVAELWPGPTSMAAFKVTDNCWHGYPPYEGKRQSIQINFLTSGGANSKHRFFHRLSAKVKSLFH